ncbi:MAG TPA: class I tRNA ligase family protein [Thermoplasmata archaeon]|nr:class I tRNA ligase family protein [Thermoplasmata archaeon]
MDPAREGHWQAAWRSAGLATARRDPGKAKFYALVAYPGSSGFLHVGHLRGVAYADSFHRFRRMRGEAVFFPTGTHASGLPAVTFAQRVKARDETVVAQLVEQEVPESDWARLEEPAEAARFLGRSYLDAFRELGCLIDETAYVTTIDDDYQAFIRWQFRVLERRGALRQAPHFAAVCPVCGPVSVDASETDLSSGGDADRIEFATVPFPLDDGRVLLAATLRPETVFGVTNLWVAPGGTLAHWHLGGTTFLVAPSAAERLVEQHGGHIGPSGPVDALLGRLVTAPLSGRRVPIVASRLVDPSVGTGVVMSVPAHAPADWLALQAVPETIRASLPIPEEILSVDPGSDLTPSERALTEGPGVPAERAARLEGAASLDDAAAIAGATERLYRFEFARGRMRPGILDGRPVPEAREAARSALARLPGGLELHEFSKPVVCRNGHAVVIRKVPDQWFIHYGDPAWKTQTRALVARMRFRPAEYGTELPGILDWFGDRPCTRRGRWLGTPFPLDPSWIIEPIADSTFYPAYFVVRRYVADGRLRTEQLTDALFDRVFLGEGPGEPTVDRALEGELRAEFEYWYPLDLNIGGKEHKRVHFPAFLATHALLLPDGLRPRGIFVHWWLTEKGGGKLSKKRGGGKGGGIPRIHAVIARWGADAIRLYFALAASPEQDIEWDPGLVEAAATRLADVEHLAGTKSDGATDAPAELDAWLSSAWHDLVAEATAALEAYDVRAAAERIYVTAPTLIRRYLARGGVAGRALDEVRRAWVRLMSPVTPHLAEEVGSAADGRLVAASAWPEADEFARSRAALAAEAYLDRVEDDLRSVVRLAEGRPTRPTAAALFVAAPWKRIVDGWIREAMATGGPPEIRAIVARATAHPEVAAHRAEVGPYVARVAKGMRGAPGSVDEPPVDELAVLRGAEGYLARRFGLGRITVVPEELGEEHDPEGRRDRAQPGRPAFYLTRGPS